jgi:hypothetical protein
MCEIELVFMHWDEENMLLSITLSFSEWHLWYECGENNFSSNYLFSFCIPGNKNLAVSQSRTAAFFCPLNYRIGSFSRFFTKIEL